MGTPLQPIDCFVVRLADEGVPLRAIARAVKIPSEDLRDQLYRAKDEGKLLSLPREDWPPGFPRDQRALQLSRMVSDNREAMLLAMQQVFGLTSTEVGLLVALLQNTSLAKQRDDMSTKAVDVHICRIRAHLKPFSIDIETIWGHGYQLSPDNRRRMMDMILARVQEVI
jgi:Transcriptional regulatory protein, C terminal